jgi:hypothetical protein
MTVRDLIYDLISAIMDLLGGVLSIDIFYLFKTLFVMLCLILVMSLISAAFNWIKKKLGYIPPEIPEEARPYYESEY